MQFSEKEFESYLFDELVNNDGEYLEDQDISLPTLNTGSRSTWRRQVNLNPYGIADIIGVSRKPATLVVDILELKITPSEIDHFDQLARYRTGVFQILKKSGFTAYIEINCFLFVNNFDKGCYLQNICPVSVVEYDYTLRGLQFRITKAYSNWYMTAQDQVNYDYKNFIRNGRLQKD